MDVRTLIIEKLLNKKSWVRCLKKDLSILHLPIPVSLDEDICYILLTNQGTSTTPSSHTHRQMNTHTLKIIEHQSQFISKL